MTEDLANDIRTALRAEGYAVEDGDEIRLSVQLEDGGQVELLLVPPSGFPYELPEFKLTGESLATYGELPHVGPTGLVCAFDRETNRPNPENAAGQVLEVLERTKEILSAGIRGENEEDYLDEFLAYWSYGQDCMLPLYSLADSLSDEPKTLTVYAPEDDERRLFICDSDKEALMIAEKLNGSTKSPCLLKCVYLPLRGLLRYPFPRTHGEWFEAIKADGANMGFYQRFLQKSDREKTVVVVSCAYQDGRRVFAAFGHSALPTVKGFRGGRVPLEVAMTKIGKTEVVRYDFVDTSHARLYRRGGNGRTVDMKACVIGCGSLGGYLVESLKSCGISDFTLVDREYLSVDNIARHLCGFGEVGKLKAEAVRSRVIADDPNIKCAAITRDANVVLDNSPVDLKSDYVFVTVGSYPLETHVTKAMLNGTLDSAVVLMWLEPHALAAHALVLNHPQDVQQKMFDEMGLFNDSVVANGAELFKREAGCQSTFVQYSGLDVRAFTIDFVRNLAMGRLSDHNYHFAWYGALSLAGEYGAAIAKGYESRNDYTSEIQRVD